MYWPEAGGAARVQDPAWVTFRERVLDKLDPGRFFYLDADRCAVGCPVCQTGDGWLMTRLIGKTPRAEISCLLGCSDDEISAAVGLEAIS